MKRERDVRVSLGLKAGLVAAALCVAGCDKQQDVAPAAPAEPSAPAAAAAPTEPSAPSATAAPAVELAAFTERAPAAICAGVSACQNDTIRFRALVNQMDTVEALGEEEIALRAELARAYLREAEPSEAACDYLVRHTLNSAVGASEIRLARIKDSVAAGRAAFDEEQAGACLSEMGLANIEACREEKPSGLTKEEVMAFVLKNEFVVDETPAAQRPSAEERAAIEKLMAFSEEAALFANLESELSYLAPCKRIAIGKVAPGAPCDHEYECATTEDQVASCTSEGSGGEATVCKVF